MQRVTSHISFHFKNVSFFLPKRKLLKAHILKLFLKEKTILNTLNIVFCEDEYLLTLNKSYLRHNSLTDVITFNLSSKQSPIEGEIYISVDRVRDNANHFNRSFRNELMRVVFHGALHLCGYKDKNKRDKAIMTQKEDFYLQTYQNVPRGT